MLYGVKHNKGLISSPCCKKSLGDFRRDFRDFTRLLVIQRGKSIDIALSVGDFTQSQSDPASSGALRDVILVERA